MIDIHAIRTRLIDEVNNEIHDWNREWEGEPNSQHQHLPEDATIAAAIAKLRNMAWDRESALAFLAPIFGLADPYDELHKDYRDGNSLGAVLYELFLTQWDT